GSENKSFREPVTTHTYYFPQDDIEKSYFVFYPICILTDSLNCTVYKELDSIVIYKSPTVKFYGDTLEGCRPLKIQFSDSSGLPDAAYSWDFGNGTASSEKDPLHVYP